MTPVFVIQENTASSGKMSREVQRQFGCFRLPRFGSPLTSCFLNPIATISKKLRLFFRQDDTVMTAGRPTMTQIAGYEGPLKRPMINGRFDQNPGQPSGRLFETSGCHTGPKSTGRSKASSDPPWASRPSCDRRRVPPYAPREETN